jgi:hypothetical protein
MDTVDWRIMLNDIKAANPQMAARIESEPDFRKTQEDNIRQLFAFACAAVKDGVLKDAANKAELENIRAETTAVKFDRLVDKKDGSPPFSSTTDAQSEAFSKLPAHEKKFDDFLKVKLEILKRNDAASTADPVSPEVREEARKTFARISIRDIESRTRARRLQPDFWVLNALQVKLQQAQFLARQYADTRADEILATEDDIDEYIQDHPELDRSTQRTKAEQILARAVAGEDFAALANEFTEDPGNAGPQGKNGGLYKDVPLGQMIPEFEQGALALKAGQVAPQLVETVYGYHVIKLDRKGGTPETYDVRHILLATTIKDPEDPDGREVPVREFVRQKLQRENGDIFVARLVAENNIYVAPIPVGAVVGEKQTVKRRPGRRK